MKPVDQFEMPGTRAVTFAANQPEYDPLPALILQDGAVLTEWELTDEERQAIARGENLRLWIWPCGHPLQPVMLTLTDERQG